MFWGGHWFKLKMLLIVAGVWWCAHIFGRRHEDIAVMRESKDAVERGVVIGFWLSALIVAALLSTYGVATIVEFATRIRDIVR